MSPRKSYREYFYKWSEEQNEYCNELRDALNDNLSENELQQLVQKVLKHYQDYYAAKDGAVKEDVLKVLNPTWRSPLENAFLWIGGWRPTILFQLAYAQAGQQIELELVEFLHDLDTPTMAHLSSKQLSQISNLQIQTQKAEDNLAHRQAVIQQGLADQPLLTFAQAGGARDTSHDGDHGSSLRGVMDEKVKAQEELLGSADELRYGSLKAFLKILTTTQAAQYLVAAGQLHLAVRKIGAEREEEGPSA